MGKSPSKKPDLVVPISGGILTCDPKESMNMLWCDYGGPSGRMTFGDTRSMTIMPDAIDKKEGIVVKADRISFHMAPDVACNKKWGSIDILCKK